MIEKFSFDMFDSPFLSAIDAFCLFHETAEKYAEIFPLDDRVLAF